MTKVEDNDYFIPKDRIKVGSQRAGEEDGKKIGEE